MPQQSLPYARGENIAYECQGNRIRACRAPIDGGEETCSLAVLTCTVSTCIFCESTASPGASVGAAIAEPSLAVATSVARGVATF